jgi:hypothetical protein
MIRDMSSNPPSQAPAPLWVYHPDGRMESVPDGDFRSRHGKLLFVRRGVRIEIRCPRSKELYEFIFSLDPPSQAA